MKKVLFPVLFFCLAASIRGAEDAERVVDKVLQASGGVERLKQLGSRRFEGKVVFGGGVLSGTFLWEAKRPDLFRIDFDLGGLTASQGFDGSRAWQLQPAVFGGSGVAEPLAGPEGDAIRQNAEFDSPFLDYKSKGHRIEMVDRERVEGRETVHLRLTRQDGNVADYYIDAVTHHVFKVVNTRDIPQLGGEVEVELLADDYRPVDGLDIPHHFVTRAQGQTINELTIEKVELNLELDGDRFRMPSK